MAEHNELGKRGETMAANFLEENGYCIKHRNWQRGTAELDIVAEKDGILIFVEVKTRMTDNLQHPEMAVTKKKAKQIAKAAGYYTFQEKYQGEVRFDIIAIVIQKNIIRHIEDAFYPTWDWAMF